MSGWAIRTDGLGKRFHRGGGALGLRGALENVIRAPLATFHRAFSGAEALRRDAFWALRDISFELKRGEVVGVIGHNGAGKSVLLKILSRVTVPTVGRAAVRGRLGALLEVGTGFHPDLTGRENVYFNGAMLGMKRDDVRREFDSIVAFSEIEVFLDSPVKNYSSGMRIRLAFAVAAHVQPEILVIDEALAVGDYAFQRKCLGRLRQFIAEGRTLILVSHGQQMIRDLCSRAIVLEEGQMIYDGAVDKALARYMNEPR